METEEPVVTVWDASYWMCATGLCRGTGALALVEVQGISCSYCSRLELRTPQRSSPTISSPEVDELTPEKTWEGGAEVGELDPVAVEALPSIDELLLGDLPLEVAETLVQRAAGRVYSPRGEIVD